LSNINTAISNGRTMLVDEINFVSNESDSANKAVDYTAENLQNTLNKLATPS